MQLLTKELIKYLCLSYQEHLCLFYFISVSCGRKTDVTLKKKKSLIFGYNFSCLLTNVKTLFKMGM